MPSKATVQKFIKFCPYCQKLASKKVALPAPQGSLQVTRPFEELSLDTVGPLTPCNITGFTFYIVAVDSFSRFVFAEALADTSAESAAQFIHKHLVQANLQQGTAHRTPLQSKQGSYTGQHEVQG